MSEWKPSLFDRLSYALGPSRNAYAATERWKQAKLREMNARVNRRGAASKPPKDAGK